MLFPIHLADSVFQLGYLCFLWHTLVFDLGESGIVALAFTLFMFGRSD